MRERGEDKRHRKAKIEEADGSSGEKESVSLSLFLEMSDVEVEEELSTVATQAWAEGVWMGKWPAEHKEAWRKQIFEVQTWRQVRGLAGAVIFESRDLGIKWPQWHTILCEGQCRVDMIFVCPQDEENASEAGQNDLLEEVGNHTRV